ncbi:polysaccharide biosynthesis C-terminal domain-containing protein [Rhodobacteraceae bacterium N5(2021)]|uniref:Polysaccharide biosynthesis C-terminal domain-containing protein n=1 Tax=Gymnodinialimonas phycosphaerae TaxID=2841589 RepID=A0A975TRJ9_9RHOB|nr:MATE family efflux transporter [Gymnodinialimonas phycosphaerae]MBY4893668.1 polysaccharide biosynthesis C-terminal domain-containing protein [Gymnodinialimonas phycosphaerae]
MTTAPNVSAIYAVAWPLTLKALMLHGIVVIDAYLISALGEEALAAMGLAGALVGLLLGILFAFSNATQIRIAQSFGATGQVRLKTAFYCGLVINLGSVLIGVGLVALFGRAVIESAAQTDWIAAQAMSYLQVFLIVVFAEAIGQCLGSHFNGCGNPRVTFYSYLIAMPINIGASIILIYGLYGAPELGVAGAAYGSAIASLTRVMFMGVKFFRENRLFLDVKGWLRDSFAMAFKRHLLFSLPIAGTFLSMTIGTQVCVLIYARMSINDFAAITLIMPWVQVAGTFGMSWAQATGILVAQLLGAGADEATLDTFLSRAWRAAFVAAAVVSGMYLVLCLLSPWIYAGLEVETRAALWMFLPTLLLLPFPKGSNAICGQTLRAAGDTLRVMNIFVASQWLFKVPMTLLLVLVWDVPVAWVFSLFLMEEIVKLPMFHRRLWRGDWKRANVDDV